MKRITAVEYIEKTIQHMIYNGGDLGEDAPALMEQIKRAKVIEKEHIINAVTWGPNAPSAEKYYDETYGKNN